MQIFRLISLCEGNLPVTGELPSHVASNAGFGVFFEDSLYKLWPVIWDVMVLIWRHRNVYVDCVAA